MPKRINIHAGGCDEGGPTVAPSWGRDQRTAIGATVEPVKPWAFSGCMMNANS